MVCNPSLMYGNPFFSNDLRWICSHPKQTKTWMLSEKKGSVSGVYFPIYGHANDNKPDRMGYPMVPCKR